MQPNSLLQSLIKFKKIFFPTKYDKEQKHLHKNRLSFYSQFIKKNDLCVDVGANVGNRTQIFLELGAKVISVEPQKSCYEILEKKFGNKIQLIKKGLGSKNEIKEFYISNENQVSTFSADWIETLKQNRFKTTEWNGVEKIEIVTLDSILPNNVVPSFIKIDVEGFELEVLNGLTKKFRCLSFEFAVPENFNGLNLCLDRLNLLNKNFLYNLAVQDNTYLENKEWQSYSEFKTLINSQQFINNFAGDIYVKL